MALITSEAALKQRCSEISADGSLHASLVAQGIKTFRQLAFVLGTPRTEPTTEQFRDLAAQVFGASPALGMIASLRDLHFEATTYVVQAFKDQVSEGSEGQLKRLPMPEKTARAQEQQSRLSGVEISGEMQPSHALIDKCNTMYESGALHWLPPSLCSKRDAEVAVGITERPGVLQLEKDSLKLASPPAKIAVDVSSPLALQWAWKRRGIALDQCSLLSWSVHEFFVSRMLNLLSSPVPAGYSMVQPSQLIRADKEIWTLLAREVSPPYKLKADGSKPLDAPFKAMVLDARIQIWLMPAGKGATPVPDPETHDDAPPKAKRFQRVRKKAKTLMPEELKTCPRFSKGPCCWAYNQQGCKNETKDVEGMPRCQKGFHVCAFCHKPGHSFKNCRARSSAKA